MYQKHRVARDCPSAERLEEINRRFCHSALHVRLDWRCSFAGVMLQQIHEFSHGERTLAHKKVSPWRRVSVLNPKAKR